MFDSYVRDHAYVTPRAPAVVTPGRAFSYAEFNADIDRFAAALIALGLTAETGVVSVAMDQPYLTYVLTLALARLGIASGPYHDPGAAIRLTEARAGAGDYNPGPRRVILTPEWIDQTLATVAKPQPIVDLSLEGLGRVMLSSGTTRAPRRVAMSWRRIQATVMANLSSRAAGMHGVWVVLTTVEAIQGFGLALGAWSQGAAVTAGVGVEALPAIMESRPSGLIGCTPAQLRMVLAMLPHDFRPQAGWRVSAGGSRLPASLAQEARLRLTPDIRVTYGATEAQVNTHGRAIGLENEPGQVGFPVAGTIIEIVDDAGRPLPDGQSGAIRIKGERVADGYIDDPVATAERFKDGYFYTQDIGHRLSDGRLVLEGRTDDVMNLDGGRKFMPALLEDAASACPGVIDCAAFAVTDAEGLDQCWLAVVTAPEFDRDSLAVHLSNTRGLPPNRFAWTDQIPRNAMGKVERSKLREALVATLRKAGA